jgi:hypothetical protein
MQKLDKLKVKLGVDSRAPTIVLVNPKIDITGSQDVTVNKSSVEIYGNVQDSSGLSAVTVNGKQITKIEDDGGFVSAMELQPGENKIVLTAIDKYENKSERIIKINYNNAVITTEDTSNIPELFTTTNYHAILIAEKDYEDAGFADLSSPVNDANELKKILIEKYDFDEANVSTLYNTGAQSLLDSIEHKANTLTDADNLLVFYAGHGDVKKINNNVVGGYLIPVDAKKGSRSTYISSENLKEAVQASEAKHILFLVDACFGGALMRSVMDDAPPSIKNQFTYKSRKILASGNIEEVPDHGKFIQLLLEYLKNNTQPYTSAFEVFSFLHKNAEGTMPQFNRIESLGDNGGNFIFVRKNE